MDDFRKESRVRGAVARLKRQIYSFEDFFAAVDTVIDARETIQQGSAFSAALGDAALALVVFVLAGVAVYGAWKEVCATLFVEEAKELNVLFDQRDPSSWLRQRNAIFFRPSELGWKAFVLWNLS